MPLCQAGHSTVTTLDRAAPSSCFTSRSISSSLIERSIPWNIKVRGSGLCLPRTHCRMSRSAHAERLALAIRPEHQGARVGIVSSSHSTQKVAARSCRVLVLAIRPGYQGARVSAASHSQLTQKTVVRRAPSVCHGTITSRCEGWAQRSLSHPERRVFTA